MNIENLDWVKCVTKYDRDETLFYLDPPYWGTAGYGGDFGFEQYELMAELMGSMKGKAIVSINDHKDIRQAFKGFKMQTVGLAYTVGGAGKRKPAKELIIRN